MAQASNSQDMLLSRKAYKKAARKARAEERARRRAEQGHDYTVGEEIANAITHGVGAGLAVAAIPLSIVFAADNGALALVSAIIYSVTMLLEYTVSTLYHAIQPMSAKRVFRVLDHSFIYLYIAASYMPYCLVTLFDSNGLALCIFVWVVAVLGVAFEAFWVNRPRWISAVIYVALGWSVVIFVPQLYVLLPAPGFWLLLAGGLSYTVGALFYLATKKIRFMHSVFHVFVLGGSICQFLSILLFVF